MTPTWMIFYGHQMGMSRQEVINTTYGEMLDMISCLSIYNGSATYKDKKEEDWDFEDALLLK